MALGRRTPVTPTEHLKEGAVCFILGKRTSKKRTLKSDAEGLHVLTGLLASAHASRFSQLCSLPFLQAYFHETLAGETIALDTPLKELVESLPEAAVSTSDPLGQLVATHRRFLQPGVDALGGGDPGDLSDDRLTAMADYAQKVGFAGSEAAASPERYQGLLTRDYGVFLRGKGGENALLSCTPGGHPLIVPSDDGTPTIQPHRVSRNLGDEAAASALDALLVQHGLTEFRPDGLVKSKFANTPDDPITDNALDVRDGALYNVAAQGPAAAASWTGDSTMAVGTLDKVLVVLICDCWHDEATEPLLQPGAIDTTAKHDAYCALRKKALAEGFNAADFEAKQLRAFQGELKEAGRLACFRVVTTTSSQLVNYGKYRPSAATATSAETKSTQELTGASRCGLKMCNRFSELIVGGWEIGRVLDTSLSRAALPPGAPLQARSGVNTSLSKVDVNIAWRSSVALHRMYANSEGEVAARYEKTKTAVDLKAVNARLPSRLAFETRREANTAARAGAAASGAREQAEGLRRTAETLVTMEGARQPPDAARLGAAKALVTNVGAAADAADAAATTAQEAVRATEDAFAVAMRTGGAGAAATATEVLQLATKASARAAEAAAQATTAAEQAASLVTAFQSPARV